MDGDLGCGGVRKLLKKGVVSVLFGEGKQGLSEGVSLCGGSGVKDLFGKRDSLVCLVVLKRAIELDHLLFFGGGPFV